MLNPNMKIIEAQEEDELESEELLKDEGEPSRVELRILENFL